MKTETIGTASLETWSVAETAAAFARNEVVLIDVRTAQEYLFEHIEGALLLPMSFFQAEKLPGQQAKRIVFLCGSGIRSDKVARKAIESGMTPVAHLEGGFAAWKAAGQPYIGTDMATGGPKRINPAA
jgi:rhodanese-related sulfurtransferase